MIFVPCIKYERNSRVRCVGDGVEECNSVID